MSGVCKKILVRGKATRFRRSNWTDEEVRELCRIWTQPEILIGLRNGQGHTRKQQAYGRICDELSKIGSNRDYGECRHKLKNMRRAYRRAKKEGTLDSWRFKDDMEKVVRLEKAMALTSCAAEEQQDESDKRNENEDDDEDDFVFDICEDSIEGYAEEDPFSAGRQNITLSTENQLNGMVSHPVEIEFELMDLVKGQMPVEIEGGSIVVPQEFANDVGIVDSCTAPPAPSYTTTTAQSLPNNVENSNHSDPSSSASVKRGLTPQEVQQKRRKLQSLSDKMIESVSRVLTKSTSVLIEEMKKSEERFIKWEEERREKDRKQEEAMLKKLLEAFKTGRNDGRTNYTAQGSSQSFEVPSTSNFDSLANNLMETVTERTRELEESFLDWERRMHRTETTHTENLFKMILSAVNNTSQQ